VLQLLKTPVRLGAALLLLATLLTPGPADAQGGATAPVSCRVVFNGGSATVTWTRAANDNALAFVIRRGRDGATPGWTGRVSAPGTSFTQSGLSSQSTYLYTVESKDAAQVSSAPRTCSAPGGGDLPVAPTACVVERNGDTATVSWTRAANDNAVAVVVRRSRNGGAFGWAGRVAAPTTTFVQSGLASQSVYAYTVETKNAGERASTPTPCTSEGGGGDPVAPVSCSVVRTGSSATVTWVRAGGDNAASFIVRRSRDGGTFGWTGRVDAPGTSFTQGGLSSGSVFTYAIEARAANGVQSAATSCSNQGGGGDPVAPVSCSVVRTGSNATVTWVRAGGDNAASFIVRRSRDGGTFGWTGRVDVPGTSFTQGGLSGASTYAYRVETRAANGTASSARSCTVAGAQIERVLHISVDGLRPDHVTAAITPNILTLVNQGQSTMNARSDYYSTVTLPNHIGQVTSRRQSGGDGFKVTFNDDNGQTIHDSAGFYVASAFDVAHDNGLQTYALVGKDKFDMFDRSWNATNGAVDTTGANNGRDKIDQFQKSFGIDGQTSLMSAHITNGPADYMFWHMPAPDGFGHQFGWGSPEYQNAVVRSDASIGVILGLIAADPALATTTAIVLTSDHGGVSSGSFAHSDFLDERNYTVPFVVWGPGINPGNLYSANAGIRQSPGTSRPDEAGIQPVRGAEAGNVSMQLLGLPPIPGSRYNASHDLQTP
jgi:hypothetical protein